MSVIVLKFDTDDDVGTNYGSCKSIAFTRQGESAFKDVVKFLDTIVLTDTNGRYKFAEFSRMVAITRKRAERKKPTTQLYCGNMSIGYCIISEYYEY